MRPHRRILIISASAFGVLAMSAAPALAERGDTITVPAPPGFASAVALQVGSLIDISKTEAAADPSDSSAQASVIRIGGHPLFNLGGVQKGEGESAGYLIDTGNSLPIRVEVAPWEAAAHSTPDTRTADSAAAVLRADLPKVVHVDVLESESHASHKTQKSTGHAISNAADVSLLEAINVVLLHSEVSTEGRGHSYLIGLNGNEIGTDDQLGKSPLCALSLPSVLSLSCLTASGGTSGTISKGAAEVARVAPTPEALAALNPAAAFTTAANSGAGEIASAPLPAPIAAAETPRTGEQVAPAVEAAVAVAPAPAPKGILPRTGSRATGLAGSALGALVIGMMLRRLRKVR